MRATNTIGVGIDVARHGHHVTFLDENLQQPTPPVKIRESAEGYQQLRRTLDRLAQKFPGKVFRVRIDCAGQYAANIDQFLRSLPLPLEISLGNPRKNKAYCDAHFGGRKNDPTESYSMARFVVVENPKADLAVPQAYENLRAVTRRLRQVVEQQVLHCNQLHNLLARVFPELPYHASQLNAQFVLQLLERYPTAEKIAHAKMQSLIKIPYLTQQKAVKIQNAARNSIASFRGQAAQELVKGLVKQIQQDAKDKKQLEKLLADVYRELPTPNFISTIPGIGEVTAAVLTAKIVDIDRFDSPEKLVGYFGAFPNAHDSGVHPDGTPKHSEQASMCKRGDDLVRRYLFTVAKTAANHNPACRALYRRLRDRGTRPYAAYGHVMRKLLHLVFAVWKSNTPFRNDHYPWEGQAEPLADIKETADAAGRTQLDAAR